VWTEDFFGFSQSVSSDATIIKQCFDFFLQHLSDLSFTNCPSVWQYVFCLQKHITEGKIEGMGRRGRRRKQLLDDLK
jgi:hypothetical protein